MLVNLTCLKIARTTSDYSTYGILLECFSSRTNTDRPKKRETYLEINIIKKDYIGVLFLSTWLMGLSEVSVASEKLSPDGRVKKKKEKKMNK